MCFIFFFQYEHVNQYDMLPLKENIKCTEFHTWVWVSAFEIEHVNLYNMPCLKCFTSFESNLWNSKLAKLCNHAFWNVKPTQSASSSSYSRGASYCASLCMMQYNNILIGWTKCIHDQLICKSVVYWVGYAQEINEAEKTKSYIVEAVICSFFHHVWDWEFLYSLLDT